APSPPRSRVGPGAEPPVLRRPASGGPLRARPGVIESGEDARRDDREGGGAVRVGVLGATGRMGRATCRAVLDAADLELAAVVARATKVGHPPREGLPEAPGDLL